MIPTSRVERDVIAGEFVLGLLERDLAREVEAALDFHVDLRRMVAFWEEQLDPVSRLAPEVDPPAFVWRCISERLDAEPPENMWSRIVARLGAVRVTAPRARNPLRFWQAATVTAIVAAVCLALYSALMSHETTGPSLVAVFQAPRGQEPDWIATISQDTLLLRAVKKQRPPMGRAFELWVIPPNGKPQSLGVVPLEGRFRLERAPSSIRDGATLAISIEPMSGSPTGQPTGPVIFAGMVVATR